MKLMMGVWLMALLGTVLVVTAATAREGTDRKLNIDPVLRNALLRALRHLKERQEEERQEQELLGDANTTEENYATTILDELLEESTAADESGRPNTVNYHTYVAAAAAAQAASAATADGSSDDGGGGETQDEVAPSDDRNTNEIIKTIIIAKPKATVGPAKQEADNEIVPMAALITEAPGTPLPVPGTGTSVASRSSAAADQPALTPTVGSTTSSVPSTEAPTHNEDGENIEQVKSEDVKIQQAPLVAAFTVQQDGLGVPRNVIPLLLQSPPPRPTVVESGSPLPPLASGTAQPFNAQSGQVQGGGFKSALVVAPKAPVQPPTNQPLVAPPLSTRALEEKTRLLEQQLIALQKQQRAQEQLLRAKIEGQEQAIFHQQQLLQHQKQRLDEETRLQLLRFEQDQRLFRQQQQQQQQQVPQFQQLTFKPQPLPLALQKQQQLPQLPQPLQAAPQPTFIQELPRPIPAVQFIPSVSLPGGKPIPVSVEQQLPFKEAVDFQPVSHQVGPGPKASTSVEQVKSVIIQQQQQPPPQPHLSRDQALPLKPFQPFHLLPVLPPQHAPGSFLPPLPAQAGPSPFDQQLLPLQQRHRVFRQEPPTGNFGLSPALPPPPPGAFTWSSQPLVSDSQNLQHLLLQSGITARSAEDFNIITKVLALNHGIPEASSQRMFAKLSPDQQRQLLFRK